MDSRRRDPARRQGARRARRPSLAADQLEVALLDRDRARAARSAASRAPSSRRILAAERGASARAPVRAARATNARDQRRSRAARARRPTTNAARRRSDRRPTTRRARRASSTSSASSTYAGVVELVLGHVHVDPGHVADGEAVGAVDRAPQLGVDALVERSRASEHLGRNEPCDLGEAHHRHRTSIAHDIRLRTASPEAGPTHRAYRQQ